MNLEFLKYPVGRYLFDSKTAGELLSLWINNIAEFPKVLLPVISQLTKDQLDTTYRPDGWSVRQVIHHMADSHSQALTRFKWTLTEENTAIKAYDEVAFALLPDYQMPIDCAVDILKGTHAKLGYLLKSMSPNDWNKTYFHPQQQRPFTLLEACGLYDWHSRHHLGHVQLVINKM